MFEIEQRRGAQNGPYCIWMQAGVVRYKQCSREYDCPACQFDRTLQQVARENQQLRESGQTPPGKRGQIVNWRDMLRSRPAARKPCIHTMKGRIAFRPCTNGYYCGDCEFDQYFDDQFSVHAVVRPVDLMNIKGFKIPQGFYLHPGHTWLKVEAAQTVRVGLDDFALRLLGPLDGIETPLLGEELVQGRGDIRVRRQGRKARFRSPVSGVVTKVNPRLEQEGALANAEPYGEGWVLQLHGENLRHEVKSLFMGEQTAGYYDREIDRLYEEIETVAGPLAADGGYLGDDIYGNLPGLEWRRLTRMFLGI